MSIDLTPADQDAVRALNRLRNNQDFVSFQKWLDVRLRSLRKQNDMLTGDQLKWSQGQCQALQKVLDSQEIAVKILKNAR
jgi:hypothetical protein